jgi:uncharacterized protein
MALPAQNGHRLRDGQRPLRAAETSRGRSVLGDTERKGSSLTRTIITDLVQIKRLGEKGRDENKRFRSWLKSHNFVERRLKALAQEVEDSIDCTSCGNCCRVATTQIQDRDAERLARFLGMRLNDFLRDYTVESADEGRILKRTENGCVFLEGTMCSVYEARPQTCEYFPHLVKGAGSLVSRMWHMPDRAVYCPITYNTLEEWKAETGFKK